MGPQGGAEAFGGSIDARRPLGPRSRDGASGATLATDQGIERAAFAAIPARHFACVGSVKVAGTCEPAQHASAYLPLHGRDIFSAKRQAKYVRAQPRQMPGPL